MKYEEKYRFNKKDIVDKVKETVEKIVREAKSANKKFRVRIVGSDGTEHLKVNVGIGLFAFAVAPVATLIAGTLAVFSDCEIVFEELIEEEPRAAA